MATYPTQSSATNRSAGVSPIKYSVGNLSKVDGWANSVSSFKGFYNALTNTKAADLVKNNQYVQTYMLPGLDTSSSTQDITRVVQNRLGLTNPTYKTLYDKGTFAQGHVDVFNNNGQIVFDDPVNITNSFVRKVRSLLGAPALPPQNPSKYDWNLPPHQWSLPTFPTGHPGGDSNLMPNSRRTRKPPLDMYRRGRIWWRATDQNTQVFNSTDDQGNPKSTTLSNNNREYGFQFLWNPQSFSTAVQVQMDATPSATDRFLAVAGAFPATETVTFNILLDRVNDFACASGNFDRPTQTAQANSETSWISKSDVAKFIKYYQASGSFTSSLDASAIQTKLIDLYQRGTLADVEYLYKAINGSGPGSSATDAWVNGRGTKTADIGFLMPTLLNIDIGPLSYQGYVSSLTVNHTYFTQDMIPLRTELTISLNILATAGITTQRAMTAAANASSTAPTDTNPGSSAQTSTPKS